jgi:transposase-like protein
MTDTQSHRAGPPVPELQPPCPICGKPMWLIRLGKFDDSKDLRTFRCQVCLHTHSKVVSFDPGR